MKELIKLSSGSTLKPVKVKMALINIPVRAAAWRREASGGVQLLS